MPFIELSCAVGSPFDVRRFTVRESMSQNFIIEIIAVSQDPSIDLDTIVNNTASLKLDTGLAHASRSHRYWAGYVQHAEQTRGMLPWRDGSSVFSTYFLRIVPRLWLLTQRTGYRIFQHLSIPEIIDKLLGEWRIAIDWQLQKKEYLKLEYKAQYGEDDLSFFSRLLEEAGITYAFIDKEGEMKLTLTDAPTVRSLRTAPSIRYFDQRDDASQQEYVTALRLHHDVRPGALSRVDYDFRNPNKKLLAEGDKSAGVDGFYERYEYSPGQFLVKGQPGQTPIADDRGAYRYDMNHGQDGAKKSLVADRTGRRAIEFETNVVDLGPGTIFKIDNHPHDALTEQELMVTGFEITGAHDGDWQMVTRAVFRADPYRPARRTPKPKVSGVQSARVVGPGGQEIHVDEFGRVRVQFPWDREGQEDDDSSVWIRVSHGWAGVHYGMICIPRIGQEVLVGFLDGDADDPIIVGRAYNAVNPVPYKLPDNKTVSGWKSHSSPTNGGYNELKIEDKANKELIYLQAQKDLHKLVKRDWTERIGRHHHRTILEDQHLIVVKTKKEWIKKDDQLHVVGDRMQKIDKSTSLTVGVDQDEKIGNKHALEAGKEIHLKAGTKVVIEGGSQLTIKGAGGFIAIHPGGVDIVGTLVRINSGGSAATGSGAKPTEPKDAEEALPKDHSEDIKD